MMIQSPINGLTSDRPLSNHWIDRKCRLNKPINGYSDV